jgi:hypothetical protein
MLNENDQDEIIRLEVYSHENLERQNENKIDNSEKKKYFLKNRDTLTILILILLYIIQCMYVVFIDSQ